MQRRSACRHDLLAAGEGCRVQLCDHGTIHLSLGPVTLSLHPDQLEAVASTLAAASARYAAANGRAVPRLC